MFAIYNGYWGYPPKPTEPEEKAREVALQAVRVRQVQSLRSPGRWLDVGAGNGTLLVRARQDGWDVSGCEIAAHLVEYAAREYDLPLFQGTLDEYSSLHQFDVISMYHILEHVACPNGLLQAAHQRLAGEGLLVVEVPNATSLDARIQGKDWKGWSLPVHFYHFSPDTLTEILVRNGFRILRLDCSPSSFLATWWARLVRKFIPRSRRDRLFSGREMCAYACKADAEWTVL